MRFAADRCCNGKKAVGERFDVRHLGLVRDADSDHSAQPGYVVMPKLARDLVESGPGLFAKAGFIPGARRQAWYAELRTGDLLGRAQRLHAREIDPGAVAAFDAPVEHADIRHTLAQQAEG